MRVSMRNTFNEIRRRIEDVATGSPRAIQALLEAAVDLSKIHEYVICASYDAELGELQKQRMPSKTRFAERSPTRVMI